MTQDCLILQGLPASGKTSRAKQWVKDGENRIRINMDDLRHMLGDYKENLYNRTVFRGAEELMRIALRNGQNVVYDNTNFRFDLTSWKREFPYVNFQVELLDEFVDVCITRDARRDNPVGKKVILNMARRYGLIDEEE